MFVNNRPCPTATNGVFVKLFSLICVAKQSEIIVCSVLHSQMCTWCLSLKYRFNCRYVQVQHACIVNIQFLNFVGIMRVF